MLDNNIPELLFYILIIIILYLCMKLIEHIYAIKNLLSRGVPSDDFAYSNRLIAHFLQTARGTLLERKADKYHFISEQSYQSLCMDLELSSFHNCCNTPEFDDCKVMKSVVEVPKFLNSRWGNFLKVMDLSGNVIPEFSLTKKKYSKYALTPPGTGWFMHDNHVYIVNNDYLEKILLNALFDDPENVHELNCPNTGGTCEDYLQQEFPIDTDLISDMYKMTLMFLSESSKMPNDTENNSKDVELTRAVQ